jgi:hypothetical protein
MQSFLSTQDISQVVVLSVCGCTWLEEKLAEEQLQPDLQHPQLDNALFCFYRHGVRLFT